MKQQRLYQTFHKQVMLNKLSHGYLFTGAKGIGKKELALHVAQSIFCENPTVEGFCNTCATCRRIQENEFSDVQLIEPDGLTIKVEQVRDLKSDLSYSSMEHGKKVYIIDGIDKMSVSAANSLLKFLEEPQTNSYFFLLTDAVERVLPTILSRVQIITCDKLSIALLQNQYEEQGVPKTISYTLANLFQNVADGMVLYHNEQFMTFYDGVLLWTNQLLDCSKMAFMTVQTKLAKDLSHKEWAGIGLDILLLYVKDTLMANSNYETPLYTTLKTKKISSMSVESIVVAKNMLYSNVSAQSCYEWLTIELSRKING